MTTWTFTIDGMHCSGCENRVETSLSKLDGVRSVEADHQAGSARIRTVAGQGDPDAIGEAVEQLGYEVTDRRQDA